MMKEIKYLEGRSIARRIKEFPPVKDDEDLQNFQKLIGKMWIELHPYLRQQVGQKFDDAFLQDLEDKFPFAYFYRYGNHLGINFKEDYLNERNLCIDGYGKFQIKTTEQ